MARRTGRWSWAGRVGAALTVAGLAGYMFAVGLGTAAELGSAAVAVMTLAALLEPHVLPSPQLRGSPASGTAQVEHSGDAGASEGGLANTGLQSTCRAGSSQVRASGDARADGPGSVANTGIQIWHRSAR